MRLETLAAYLYNGQKGVQEALPHLLKRLPEPDCEEKRGLPYTLPFSDLP